MNGVNGFRHSDPIVTVTGKGAEARRDWLKRYTGLQVYTAGWDIGTNVVGCKCCGGHGGHDGHAFGCPEAGT